MLFTGVYGSGKTSVAEEIVDLLEERCLPYGLLDLDHLAWFGTEGEGPSAHDDDAMLRANLGAVVGNYLRAGVRYFVPAGSVVDDPHLDGIRATVGMPLRVVRLTVPPPEIERRPGSSVTTARGRDDLPTAGAWIAESAGVALEDVAMPNDRPIREVAAEIVAWLGWG